MRLRLDLSYDGDAYHGWAAQPGLPTVEGTLCAALATLLRREVVLVVAGRTDAGVHARGQVAHCDISQAEWEGLTRGRKQDAPAEALRRRLFGVLSREGHTIVVWRVSAVPAEFDARFSALSRSYTYRIADRPETMDPLRRRETTWHPAPLDEAAMAREAGAVLGLRDFGSFCKPRPHSTTIRELQRFDIGREASGVLVARLTADAFCHHMVRALIGATMDVGTGKRPPGWLFERIRERSWNEKVRLAPARGLVLDAVHYPSDEQLAVRALQTRALREK